MEDKKRANIAECDREFIYKNGNILGFGSTPMKEIFTFTMALGMDYPQKLPTKSTSWIRSDTFDTNSIALMAALRLGADDINDNNINGYANYNDCMVYANMCSYAGFRKLEQMIKEANYDNDELIAELMAELDRLYRKNVELKD